MNQKLLILFLFFSITASSIVSAGPTPVPFIIPTKDVRYGAVMYEHSTGPIHLFFHGLDNTTNYWEDLGGELNQKAGMMVVMTNFRNHGTGVLKSKFVDPKNHHAVNVYDSLSALDMVRIVIYQTTGVDPQGDVKAKFESGEWPPKGPNSFEFLVEDVRNVVDAIHEMYPGREIIIGGHSTGAMTARIYLGGGKFNNKGELTIDLEEAKRIHEQKVSMGVFVAGPASFSEFNGGLKSFATLSRPMLEMMIMLLGPGRALPIGSKTSPVGESPTFNSEMRQAIRKLVVKSIAPYLPDWIEPKKNIVTSRMNQLWEKLLLNGASDLQMDLLASFNIFVADDYTYKGIFNPEVPSLHVVGQHDELANAKSIRKEVRHFRTLTKSPHILLHFLETGHMKTGSGEYAAQAILPFIILMRKSYTEPEEFQRIVSTFPTHDIDIDAHAGTMKFQFTDNGRRRTISRPLSTLYGELGMEVPRPPSFHAKPEQGFISSVANIFCKRFWPSALGL